MMLVRVEPSGTPARPSRSGLGDHNRRALLADEVLNWGIKMQSFKFAILFAAAVLASATMARADALAVGKNVAYTTVTGLPITSSSFAALTSVELPKGAKKRIVEVDVTLNETSNTATGLFMDLTINGYQIEPLASGSDFQGNEACNTSANRCTAHGLFWADLDALETAHPGVFVGQPLTIAARGARLAPSGTVTVTTSIRARMLKK